MKVLYVGEGREDIGPSEFGQREQPARGPIPILSRRIAPSIDEDCPAVRWVDLKRFPLGRTKPGFDYKVEAAILISTVLKCQGTICVADQDRDPERLGEMQQGRDRGLQQVSPQHRCICGVAVQSIEAWSLGVPDAIAAVLNLDEKRVRSLYPHNRIEELHERSGKEEHRPKMLIEKIAQLKDRKADVGFREEIAKNTDIAKLEGACPLGFKPFADALRAVFPLEICSTDDDGEKPVEEADS